MFLTPFIASAVIGVIKYVVWFVLDLLIGGRIFPSVIAICVAIIVYVVMILKTGTLSEDDILSLPMGARLLRYSRRLRLLPESGNEDNDSDEFDDYNE